MKKDLVQDKGPVLQAGGSILERLPEEADTSAFELPWETLRGILEGKSPIDLTRMPVNNREEAFELVYHYGYDLNRYEDALELQALFTQAVNFIERRLLTEEINWQALGEPASPALNIPEELVHHSNILELILIASKTGHTNRAWACAILKVMHTLSHIQNGRLYRYVPQASENILARFQSVLEPQDDGTFILHGRQRSLRLRGFEAKPPKPRESVLIKLLCKKENVAEDIWDLIGVRLITFQPSDAILAMDILRERKVIVFSNVIPSRSRNTLIDFDDFQHQYEAALEAQRNGLQVFASPEELLMSIPAKPPQENDFSHNQASSTHYRSIHLTCRQLLRIKTPGSPVEERVVFPFEIQILDEASYEVNHSGLSAHAVYKQRQLFAARRRVLGKLLDSH